MARQKLAISLPDVMKMNMEKVLPLPTVVDGFMPGFQSANAQNAKGPVSVVKYPAFRDTGVGQVWNCTKQYWRYGSEPESQYGTQPENCTHIGYVQ
jgi:hypothetical protein